MSRFKSFQLSSKSLIGIKIGIFLTVLVQAFPLSAGVALMSPPAVSSLDDETFPESHFGGGEDLAENQNRSIASTEPTDAPRTAALHWSTKDPVQEVSVIVGDHGYFPKTLWVTKDVPVRLYLTSVSKKSLCFMMDQFDIRKQVHTQKVEEISFTPKTVGQYRFYCPVNGMEGTLLVKDIR